MEVREGMTKFNLLLNNEIIFTFRAKDMDKAEDKIWDFIEIVEDFEVKR